MAQSSKILYIITQSQWGGAQRYVFDLASNLQAKGYKVEIAAGGDGELFHKALDQKITIHKLQHLVREISPVKDIKGYNEIKKLIRDSNPDIVHLNSTKAGVIGSIAAKKLKIKKIIYTVHGFVFNEPLPKWKKNLYKLAEKTTAKYKNKLICVSDFDKQSGLKNKITNTEKLIVIHNGIEKLNFLDQQASRDELNLPQDKIVIGTIANFYSTKGLHYLVEATKIITDQLPNVIFRLVGSGYLENNLKEQINKLKLENNIILGKKFNGYKYLKAFDIYALASTKEGFPYAILEAMSAGLPIITTDVGGIPEAIQNKKNGITVKPKDPQALADEIIKLIKNKDFAHQLGIQAKKDVEKNFSLEKMIEATEKIYFDT